MSEKIAGLNDSGAVQLVAAGIEPVSEVLTAPSLAEDARRALLSGETARDVYGDISDPKTKSVLEQKLNQLEANEYILEIDLNQVQQDTNQLSQSAKQDQSKGLKQPSNQTEKAYDQLSSSVSKLGSDATRIRQQYDALGA